MDKDKKIKQIILVVYINYIILSILFIVNKKIPYLVESIVIYSAYLFYVYLEKRKNIYKMVYFNTWVG